MWKHSGERGGERSPFGVNLPSNAFDIWAVSMSFPESVGNCLGGACLATGSLPLLPSIGCAIRSSPAAFPEWMNFFWMEKRLLQDFLPLVNSHFLSILGCGQGNKQGRNARKPFRVSLEFSCLPYFPLWSQASAGTKAAGEVVSNGSFPSFFREQVLGKDGTEPDLFGRNDSIDSHSQAEASKKSTF